MTELRWKRHMNLISFIMKNLGYKDFTYLDVNKELERQGKRILPEQEIIGVLKRNQDKYFKRTGTIEIIISNASKNGKRTVITYRTLGASGKKYEGKTVVYSIEIVGNNRLRLKIYERYDIKRSKKLDMTFDDSITMGEQLKNWGKYGKESQGIK